MTTHSLRTRLAGCLAGAALLAACGGGGDGASREEGIEQFKSAGFSQEESECIVDGILDDIGLDKVATDELNDEDSEKMFDIMTRCTDIEG